MLLFREIYGWLRYLVAKDPLCNEQNLVVEEIYSTFAPFADNNDGVRTLVIHRVQDGLTPRLEYRAIGLHPQIYWYPAGASEGSLIAVTNQFGFPGDYKSLNCSDFCNWMLNTIQDKFCSGLNEATDIQVTVVPTTAAEDMSDSQSFKVLDLPLVERLLKSVEEEAKHPNSNDPLTDTKINKWLKDNVGATLHDFALSVLHWFDKGKVHWKQIDYLEDEYAPGIDIIPWSWLKRNMNTRNRLSKLAPPIADRIAASLSPMAAEKVKKTFDRILRDFTKGRDTPTLNDKINFGFSAVAQFKAGAIPFQYLQQLELCDPREDILPWSFIRRSVLSYTAAAGNKIKATSDDDLVELILTWLKNSHLLLLLYKGDPEQEDALNKALEAQLKHHIKQTLKNDFWMKSVLNALSSDSVAEMKRSLQIEFDLWLFDALAPAVKRYNLPLSPHSFSINKQDQDTYGKMYKVWEKIVKDYLKDYRDASGKRLTEAISSFYTQLVSSWKNEELKEYKAKIPSASKILNAVEKGSYDELFTVLCEDLEHEVGSSIPDEIKTKLMESPFFTAISREVKLQGMLA